MLDARAADLDRRFNFGRLIIGNNVLPPVISESRDVVALDSTVMRVAGIVYKIDEPARFAMPTPTWRNWLWIGLDSSAVRPPDLVGSLPANDQERRYWSQMVQDGYELGKNRLRMCSISTCLRWSGLTLGCGVITIFMREGL